MRSGAGPLPRLAASIAGCLACAVAWYFLVRSAVAFGRVALDGQALAWAFTGGAMIGAIGCLLLLFALVARIGKAASTRGPRPKRSPGGRRAAR